MSDYRDQSHTKRDAELCAIARGVTLGAFLAASPELGRLGVTKEPIENVVERIAAITAATVVERTRGRQPFDPHDIGLVVTGVVASLFEVYVGACCAAWPRWSGVGLG